MPTLKRVEYLEEQVVDNTDGQELWRVTHWPPMLTYIEDPAQSGQMELEIDGSWSNNHFLVDFVGEEHDLLNTPYPLVPDSDWQSAATWEKSRVEEPIN